MKLRSFFERTGVEVYCFYRIKYFRILSDIALVVCFSVLILFRMHNWTGVFLVMGFALALYRLIETIKSMKDKKGKDDSLILTEKSAIDEVKKIIKGHY